MVCNFKQPGKKRELGPNKGKNSNPLCEKRMEAPKTIAEIKYCENKGMVDLIALCVNQVDKKVADEAIKSLVRMHAIEKLEFIASSAHPRMSRMALDELDTIAKKNMSREFKDEAIKAIESVSTGAEMIENRIMAEKMLVSLGVKKDSKKLDPAEVL